MRKHQQGAVIIFCLMMLSIILVLTQQLVRGVFIGSQFVRTAVDRERAEMLALGGIAVAIAQLTPGLRPAELKELQKEQGIKEGSEQKVDDGPLLLRRVLPYLNRWHDFVLHEKIDGIEGTVRVCITCEQGKINLNEAYDFKKMEFKREYELMLKALEIPKLMKPGEIFAKLSEFFKKRKRKIDDLSELLAIPGFDALDIFYRPPLAAPKGKKQESNTEIALQDIFTIWTDNDKLDPLWLSDALCAIFGIRRPLAVDPQLHFERFKQFLEGFKKEAAQDWDANWKVLEPLYEQKPKVISDIKNIFTKEFGPRVFSVLSCGNVGRTEQHLLAVIRYTERLDAQSQPGPAGQEEKKEEDGNSIETPSSSFKILRVYWL